MPGKENEFLHPVGGRVKRDPSRAAIRWSDGTEEASRTTLLQRLGLTISRAPSRKKGDQAGRDLFVVNNTAGLSMVQAKGSGAIPDEALGQLESSELVQWVAGVYRSERAPEGLEGLFTVDPTRLYLSASAATALGDVNGLGLGVTVRSDRTSKLKGRLVCLEVEDASFAKGRSSIQAAGRLAERLEKHHGAGRASDIHFENIPFISPTCHSPAMPMAHGGSSPAAMNGRCNVTGVPFVPNDTLFSVSWGLARINAPYAWALSQGDSNVIVAVIDEGVELHHPDLSVHPSSWNSSTDTPDGSPTGNHGTACAGIVAATIDNAVGSTGVAGKCRVMAIATATWADIDIAEGLYFAADGGARVVSMSFGVYESWGFWDFGVVRDALQYAHDKGLVLVAACGNENLPISRFPGSDARTICVGGSNRDDQRKRIGDASSESWWGASHGPDLSVVGPCIEIPTTDRLAADGYSTTDYTDRFNGTSAATPHVAGLAALIISLRPELTNVEVREVIERTCDKISPSLYVYALVGSKPNGAWNNETGYGRINAERALILACEFGRAEGQELCPVPSVRMPEIPAECLAPAAPPWLPFDQCIYWYETRFVDEREFQARIVYEHCLSFRGRKQGPLLYTTTLLPGESVRLYHFDRYRRVRSETQRLSVHSSFRQTVSALWQARLTHSESKYQEFVAKVRSDDDSSLSIGGQLFPVSWNIDNPDLFVSDAQGASVHSVSETFAQTVVTASQQIDAERSIVISNFEEAESQNVTARTFENRNQCRAVTYYARRVLEVYQLHTRVREISWRLRDRERQRFTPWHALDDDGGLDDAVRRHLKQWLARLPKIGAEVMQAIEITLPTDGVLYEAELAHCKSCEPEKELEIMLTLDRMKSEARKACLDAELLALEVERRRRLIDPRETMPFTARPLEPALEATGSLGGPRSSGADH